MSTSVTLSNCLLKDLLQNLARQRAAKFGQTDSLTECELLQRSHLIPSPSSSVVVSTKSLHVNFDTSNLEEEEDYLTKPRGFFADQFEASLIHCQNRSPSELLGSRIGAISMHISMKLGPRYGDKLMGILTHLSVVQVRRLVPSLLEKYHQTLLGQVQAGLLQGSVNTLNLLTRTLLSRLLTPKAAGYTTKSVYSDCRAYILNAIPCR